MNQKFEELNGLLPLHFYQNTPNYNILFSYILDLKSFLIDKN